MRKKGNGKKKIIFILCLGVSIAISVVATKLIFDMVPTIPSQWRQSIFFGCLIVLGGIAAFVSGKITGK
jgi:hypothetical protein